MTFSSIKTIFSYKIKNMAVPRVEKENHTSRDGKCIFNTLEKENLTPL